MTPVPCTVTESRQSLVSYLHARRVHDLGSWTRKLTGCSCVSISRTFLQDHIVLSSSCARVFRVQGRSQACLVCTHSARFRQAPQVNSRRQNYAIPSSRSLGRNTQEKGLGPHLPRSLAGGRSTCPTCPTRPTGSLPNVPAESQREDRNKPNPLFSPPPAISLWLLYLAYNQ